MIGHPTAQPKDERSVEDVAADWFARQRSGEMTEVEQRDLEAWLAMDPEHRLVLHGMDRAFLGLERFRASPEMLARRAQVRGRYSGVPRLYLMRGLAAGLAVALIGAATGWETLGPGFGNHGFVDRTYRTDVGQRTNVTLPDGSVVTLNTDTVLRTRASAGGRILYLDRGQAFFRVAKDKTRPFVVHAAGRTVTAVGTAFDVRVERGSFKVVLVEGKVRVAAPAPSPSALGLPASAVKAAALQTTEMVAGSQLVASDTRHWTVGETDVASATSWVTGRLKFENRPLGEVAEEFGRYSDRKIVIDDPDLALEAVSGTFEAGDVDAFVRTVQMARIARVASSSPAAIRLEPPAS